MPESAAFKKGDRVTWSSQANGSFKVKVGTVVEVVPANIWPIKTLLTQDYQASADFSGGTRPVESYIVLVPSLGQRKPQLYWPRANQLAHYKDKEA